MNQWQKDVLAAIEHLRKHHDWTLPAEVSRHNRSVVTIGAAGVDAVRVLRGGCTWCENALAIDASLACSVETKEAALLLARTLAVGWRSIVVALRDGKAIYADRKLVGRIGNESAS